MTEDVIVQLRPDQVENFIEQVRILAAQPPGTAQVVLRGNSYVGDSTEPTIGNVVIRICPDN